MAESAPDGCTRGIASPVQHLAAPSLHPKPPDDSIQDFTPGAASLAQLRRTLSPLGVTHGVVVQPSFYGTDNRVLLEALEHGDGRLVGVAAVGADVPDAELDRLAAAGVRGVRVAHFEPGDPRALGGFVAWEAFEPLEPRLAERGLHLQLLTDSRLLPALARRIHRSRVPVVVDHMGRAPARLGAAHAGVCSLIDLMRNGPLWVKLSGIANISQAGPGYRDARAVHEVLVEAAPDRLVWGSDWPHTKPAGERPRTETLRRLFLDWTPAAVRASIEWRNAARLYRLSAE